MSYPVVLLVLFAASTAWQSFTNTNFVHDIDGRNGKLALATNGGVVLLDETQPAVERTVVNTDGLPSNRCLALALDDSGNVWVATDGGGLGVVVRDSSLAWSYRPNDMPTRLSDLVWDGDRLLVGSDAGLYVVNTRGTLLDFDDDIIDQYSVARYPEILSDRVLSVYAGPEYGIGTNVGLTLVDKGFQEWRGFRKPHGDSVKAVASWTDRLLVGTELGVAVLSDTTFEPVFEFAEPHGVYQVEVAWPDIYVATDTGLFRACSLQSSQFQLVLAGDVRSLLVGDRLWAGVGAYELAGYGLRYSQTGQSWSTFWMSCIASAQVNDVAFDEESGLLYLAHYNSTRNVTRVDPGSESVRTFAGQRGLATQVHCDSRGNVWYCHFAATGGLTVYYPEADSWVEVRWGNESGWNIIDAFGIDEFDTKWVYNAEELVVAIDSTGGEVVFDIPGLTAPPTGGYDFAFGGNGRAWLGLTVGLVEIDYAGTLQDASDDRYHVWTAGLPSTEVRSVAADPNGLVWVATPQGAASWDGTRFQVYNVDNSGILSDNVYRVRVDASGRIWMLCDKGLSVFDLVSDRWTSYTPYNSGLLANHEGVTGFYASLAIDRRHGVCAVGTQRGLSFFRYGSDSAAVGGTSIRVYPNPCVLGVHPRVVVDSLPESAEVEIRTLTGRRFATLGVDEGLHRAVWEPGDVAGGLYLVLVRSPRGSHVERVALVGR